MPVCVHLSMPLQNELSRVSGEILQLTRVMRGGIYAIANKTYIHGTICAYEHRLRLQLRDAVIHT